MLYLNHMGMVGPSFYVLGDDNKLQDNCRLKFFPNVFLQFLMFIDIEIVRAQLHALTLFQV